MRASIALFLLCAIASAEERISKIEFFGTTGVDLAAVRAALPVQEGGSLPGSPSKIKQAVRRVLGQDPTDVSFTCCDNNDWIIYIGLRSSPAPPLNPKPTGRERLPKAATKLYDQTMDAVWRALKAGDTSEDGSPGYALAKNPALRSKQLEGREYALANQPLLLQVLKSSADTKSREAAAHLLGYAEQSPQQLSALVEAASDPDKGVRNNAVRALGELADFSPQLAEQIDPAPFIAMLSSDKWTDRNKACFIMMSLTQSRSPRVIAALREQSLDALLEMGRWRWQPHSSMALTILGRVAGIEETRLQEELISKGETEELFRAVR